MAMGTNTDHVCKATAIVVTSLSFNLSDERFQSRVLRMRRQYSDGDCQIMVWD